MIDEEGLNAPEPKTPESSGEPLDSAKASSPAEAMQPESRVDGPASVKHKPTIVGIGASAGGLNALKTFFRHVPADSGLAFVVVVHLSPQHESHLSDLLQPHVKMPVQQVTSNISIKPDHVYVIPPNANLSAIDTHLRLSRLEEERKERAPIDHFFRTMAATHDGNGVAVILTGTGSDGTLGIKDVKAKGGLIIVQDPNEAEFDGMPQSAIATGLVDWISRLEDIPDAIIRYDRTAPRVSTEGKGYREDTESDANEQGQLNKIFTQLKARTDRDFSRYKQSTILRRVARRMQLNYIDDLSTYVERLRIDAEEVKALADDCLITVTNFFRDPEVFAHLEKDVIPRLFRNKGHVDTIRVWSVGCATGEEAYSLAMLLAEESAKHDSPARIQVFASDLHKRSLDRAREGLYSGDIETDVAPERLRRFFHKENGGYRVQKEIRDLVVFSPHNLLSDPPFSRIDLIACRNLLIYLQRHAQRDVIELFHYALNPDGTLMLGTAEILDPSDLFRTEDKKLCFYRKRNVPVPEPRLPVFPLLSSRHYNRDISGVTSSAEVPAYGPLHQKMLEFYAPPSILVGPDDKVVHLSDNAGRYLVPPGGEVTTTAYKLVREELRLELRTALQTARQNGTGTDCLPISVRFNGHTRPVVMHVRPSLSSDRDGFTLVIFDERDAGPPGMQASAAITVAGNTGEIERLQELERELSVARQRAQTVLEEYETSREEMQASAEEMQSTNEELRSTMEELETSKEELQSINEELQAVNQENRHKVEELAQLSSDLQNLLTATEIATLFLDRDLRILRFTPKLAELFNIRIQDRGRPISDLTHRLGPMNLRADAEAVLARLIPVEREVNDESGRWFLTRVLPYRTTEDRILGVVITFVDITDRRNAEETLRANEERLRRMTSVEVVGVLTFDKDGTLIDSNEAFEQMSGYTRAEIVSKQLNWRMMTAPEHLAVSEQQLALFQITGRIGPYEKEYIRKDGTRSWMLFAGASLGDGTLVEYCIDIMDRKLVEAELQKSKHYAETIIETLHEPLLVLTPDLRVRSANLAFFRTFQVTTEETIGRTIYELGNGQWSIPQLRRLLEEILPDRQVLENFEVVHKFQHIGKRTMLLNARKLEKLQLILLGIRDVSKERTAGDALRTSEQRFRLLVDSVRDYALFQLDLSGVIVSWNSGAERLLGWKEEEAIGMSASRLFTPEDVAAGEDRRELEDARENGSAEDERWHMRADGSRFFASGVVTQVRDQGGSLLGFAKVMRDITARKENEEQLKEAVEAKSTLVREIHHRVKNNLQVIASLLSMQASYTKDPDVLSAFEEAEGRLRAIATIHERLYSSADLTEVEFSAYLKNLTREMMSLHSSGPDKIRVELDTSEMVLHIEQAIPLGLIANELIGNCLKHGLQSGTGVLRIRLGYVSDSFEPSRGETLDDGWAVLEVGDSGPGFPPGFDPRSTATFGLKLVNLLARQLRGRFEIADAPGALSIISFPLRNPSGTRTEKTT